MNINTYLIIIISLIVLDYLLDTLVDILNYTYKSEDTPTDFKDVYSENDLVRSRAYLRANTYFGIISATFDLVLIFLVIFLGWPAKLHFLLQSYTSDPVFLSLMYFGVVFILSDLIHLPFQLYKTFIIEAKFGFNKTSYATFIADKIKGYLLGACVGGLLLFILLKFVLTAGQDFWLYFWLILAVFILFVNIFYTTLIIPLFNKLTPLEDSSLKTCIQRYCNKVNFPLTNILVINGSKRSTKANAFFSGLGSKKKIVLYDTLVSQHSEEELVAILAHEVGHYKHKHIVQSLLLSFVQTGFMLWLLSRCIFNTDLSAAFGVQETAIHLNLIAFGILYSPISHITGLFFNYLSRKNEYEADTYAATTYDGQALGNALKKLSSNNLTNLTPHPLYILLHYSHPTVVQRLNHWSLTINKKRGIQ